MRNSNSVLRSGLSSRSSAIPSEVSFKVSSGPRKITPAKRTEGLFELVLEHLKTEWRSLRSLNLGVKSGTGMVDDLVLRRVATWVEELHMLTIQYEAAADTLGRLARRVSRDELQQFQVLCDVTGHEYLADFARLCVFNTSDPFAKSALCGVGKTRSGPPPRKRTTTVKQQGPLQREPYNGPRPGREEAIRFAGYLPPDHPLVQRAYQLHADRMAQDAAPPEDGSPQEEQGGEGRVSPELLRRAMSGRATSGGLLQTAEEEWEAHSHSPQYGNIEARWRRTNHTTMKEELLNPIVIDDPLPLYEIVPEYKKRYMEKLEAEKAAERVALQAPSTPTALASSRMHRSLARQPSFLNSPTNSSRMPCAHPQVPGSPGTPTTPRSKDLAPPMGTVPLPSLNSNLSSRAGSISGYQEPQSPSQDMPTLPSLNTSPINKESRFKPQPSIHNSPG